MKYAFSISLIIFITYALSAMDRSYLLPDAQTITKRLWDEGFSNFAKESKMGKELDNKCLSPITIYGKVSDILKDYKDNYPNIIKAWDYSRGEPYPPKCPELPELIRLVLQDYPNAIQALERNHWIESNEKIVEEYRPFWKK